MKHLEIVKHINSEDFYILVNAPLITTEIWHKDRLLSYGISYCRPEDTWNIVIGIRNSLKSAIDKIRDHMPKNIQESIWNVFAEEFKKIETRQKATDVDNTMKLVNDSLKLMKRIAEFENAQRN